MSQLLIFQIRRKQAGVISADPVLYQVKDDDPQLRGALVKFRYNNQVTYAGLDGGRRIGLTRREDAVKTTEAFIRSLLRFNEQRQADPNARPEAAPIDLSARKGSATNPVESKTGGL